MRGNLIYENIIGNGSRVRFVEDANGEYEVVDGGVIMQRHKDELDFSTITSPSPYKKQEQPQSALEKHYEITAFVRYSMGAWYEDDRVYLSTDEKYYPTKGIVYPFSLDDLLKSDSYKIYSVRRKSDNEEFTVDEITEQGKIGEFQITALELMGVHLYDRDRWLYISELTKKKDKLVSEEEEEKFYKDLSDIVTYYSKPLFSVNDIIAHSKEQNRGQAKGFYELDIAKFMHLAKEKLKQ